MRSQNIFNTDIVSGHTIYADIVQSTGGKVYNNSNLEIKENLYVGENALISGTIHVDQDAVLKSKLYVEDDLNVGENTQLSGTIHVDQDAVLKSKLYVEDDLNVGENTQLSGTIHVDQDAVLKSKLYVEDDLNVGENTQLSGTIHVDQDAVLKSKLYVEDDLNVGENTQLSGTIHVDQDAVFRSGLFVEGNAQINGNLYVSGDRVIMETSTVRVEDKNIELAVLDSATDATADQGGITLKGTTDKTILWSNATDSWDLSENLGIADGKYIFSDKLRARDSAGLSLEDDGGNGIFIEDGGNVGIGTTSPNEKLDVNGRIYIGNSSAPGTTTNRLYSVGGILYWDGENVLHARDTIGEMEDTSIGTKSNGQVLIWNATSSKWVNNALTGGSGIDVTNAAGSITISHSDTSSAASSNNSGRTYIQDIGLDTYGHVTSLATRTHSNAAITLTAGSGMSGGGSFDLDQSSAETITISHSDTSSAASSNNSGRTYIQDIELDTYGHVTSLSTATETVVDTNTWRAISSTPTNGATTTSISSDWAFDNVKTAVPANAVFTDTVPTFSYNSTTKTLTITT